MKQLTEERLQNIIREEVSRFLEIGGGESHAVYEIEPEHLPRLENGEHPSRFGIKMKEGDPAVLRNWANRQGWALSPRPEIMQDLFVDRTRSGRKFYVIDKNQ
jgi:hypothetical protein